MTYDGLTVGELKEKLRDLDDSLFVYLDTDSEGNHTVPVQGVETSCVIHDNDKYDTVWSADDACMDENEWKEVKAKPRIVIIQP